MNDQLPPCLLLDLDDTILADSLGAEACWRRACEMQTAALAPLTVSDLLRAINEYRAWYWSDAQRHRSGRMDLSVARVEIVSEALRRLGAPHARIEAVARAIAADYTALREEGLEPLPGALEAVDELRARGLRLALLTNGAAMAQRRKIERYNLARHFELIVIEGEFGCGKPDPRVYQHALRTLAITPSEAWMVGDNLEWDVFAPQRLGISGVWVNPAEIELPAGAGERPFRIIHTLGDLVA